MRGKKYVGFSKENGKYQQNIDRGERKLKSGCNSNFCRKSKVRKCFQITEAQREVIFQYFWSEMSWDQKKVYVASTVEKIPVKRKTQQDSRRRQGTFVYYLNVDNKKLQVCRTMFLNTLALGYKTVQEWVNNSESGMHQDEGRKMTKKRELNSRNTSSIKYVDIFLNSLPKLPSHYNRKNSKKLFLEPVFKTKIELFKVYKEFCSENNVPFVTRKYFTRRFKELNLSIYTLKKDKCNVCTSYEKGNLAESDYMQHIHRKDRAREEKQKDKNEAILGNCVLISMDLQAVKLSPYLQANALYYKTKLCCHNFTIYNMKTHDACCYWFSEDQNSDLKASTFVSCLLDYLEKKCVSTNVPIIIYSDGCTYQNRNNIMANALLNFSIKYGVTIYQKFLESGHTYMECDSVHSTIERKLQNREIHLPSDYLSVTREARRNPRPYEAVELDFNFFKNYSLAGHLRYSSIRPGKSADDPKVIDIKCIKYDHIIQIKTDFDAEWQILPVRPKNLEIIMEYPKMYTQQCKIPASKFKHLQELKSVLPRDVHHFYDTLPHL